MPTRILAELCSACGICVFQCGVDVYTISYDGSGVKVTVSAAKNCVDCCICMERCPESAIELFYKGEKYSLNENTVPLR